MMRFSIVPLFRGRLDSPSDAARGARLLRAAALGALLCALGRPAGAQNVPEVVFGYPGGGGDVGQYGKIVHDTLGRLHAAYYDAVNGDLKYALGIRNGATGAIAWTIQVVDSVGDVGLHCDIAHSPGNTPVISYHDATNRTLKLAYDRNADGDFEQDQPIFGVDPSNGFPEIRTVDATSLVTGLYTSVAVDPSGIIHMSYKDEAAGHLRYAQVFDLNVILETVDNSADQTGRYSAIALDGGFPFARPSVFYQNETRFDLYGATRYVSGWNGTSGMGFQRPLDTSGDTGFHIDAAFNPSDARWYVTYQDAVTTATGIADLQMAVVDDVNIFVTHERVRTCFDEIVVPCQFQDPIGDYGYFTSITFDSNQKPRVAHYNNGFGDLLIDRRSMPGPNGAFPVYTFWELRTLAERSGDLGLFTSISQFTYPAVPGPGTDDVLHVGFYDASRRAFRATDIVDDVVSADSASFIDGAKAGEFSSVALDQAAIPVAAFYDDVLGSLYITRRNGPAVAPWETPQLVDDSTAARLADPLDSNADNNPRTNEPDFQQTGQGVSMVAGTTDTLHLAYFDRLRRKLNYATYTYGAGAAYHTIDNGTFRGEYVSQAVSPDGATFAVAYYREQAPGFGGAAPALLVARGNGFDSWVVDVVDAAGDVGKHCSVAIDDANAIHVAYHDATNLNLKYAVQPAGDTWSVSEVTDTLSPDGIDTSIAINPLNGAPAISFYDLADAALKYAELRDTEWIVVTVDDIGDVGLQSKLVFDASLSQAAIVYHDMTNGTLKIASRQTGSPDLTWPVTLAIDSGGVGVNPAVAAGAAGRVHITYFDQTAGDLKHLDSGIPNLNGAEPAWRAYR